MAEGLDPKYFNWLLDTLYNQRGVAPFDPRLQQYPGNINEVTPNASNIPPKGTPSWQDLLGKNRYPFPANQNMSPADLAAAAKYAPAGEPAPPFRPLLTPQSALQSPQIPGVQQGPPIMPQTANSNMDPAWQAVRRSSYSPPSASEPVPSGVAPGSLAYDSVKQVGDPRARQLSPAEMYGEPEPNDVPPWAADPPSGIAKPSVIGTTLNTVSRFLPAWAQAGIAAGRAMWPTSTAPPSMDEAPPWSWPRQ